MTITWPMFIWAFGILLGWTTFLLAIIRFLLIRQLNSFVTKQAETDAKAAEALAALTKYKSAAAAELSKHKEEASNSMAALRLEFSQKGACTNHPRMESNDKDLFIRMDSLHGDIRELVGGVKGLTNSLDLISQHLLNGGK